MRAMVLHQTAPIESNPLRRQELPDPQPTGRQVRVRVRCCAICRTDLHVIEGELPETRRPLIPGHQVVGVVDRLGPDCRRLRPGQRVGIAWLRGTCGDCGFCTRGCENLCERSRYTGYHEDGGYAEYALIDEDFAYEIPDAFDDLHAAPLLCAGIIGYRALRRANLPPGGSLAIFGFGSSAHVVIQLARHRGCEVYVVSRSAAHRELALRLGARWAGATADEMPVQTDSAILFAPVGHLVPPALASLKKGGTLAIAGIYLTPVPQLDYQRHLFYEKDVRSVTANTRDDGRELLREAAEIPICPEITCYPLAEANRALNDLKHDRISGTGVLTVPD